ncbi:MAG: D-mannonate dehydratase [Spirochaetaceae bacterium]|nr:MAG: D-mannonate dehydratase [Spirochaetaceae bacterium]
MKLGFGFYQHMLNDDGYRFARQCGATHAVVHLVDYFNQGKQLKNNHRDNQPIGGRDGWGHAGATRQLWQYDSLVRIREELAAHGLTLYAIENFDPLDWYDVLLAGPGRERQLERLQQIIRDVGRAGIPVIGYNFSIAGVAGRVSGTFARGGARSVGVDGGDPRPIPRGMVWNMWYDDNAADGELPEISEQELWARLEYFLRAVLPVAEEAGVRLAAHPDDPPFPTVRRQPRLVYTHDRYQRLLDLAPSPANSLEFCLGTLQEMADGDIYRTIERHVGAGQVAYIHLRNVVGTVPRYHEVFLDEGDLDVVRVIRLLDQLGYDGVVIPDHTPLMECAAPWHAGMAFAMGYIRALKQIIQES